MAECIRDSDWQNGEKLNDDLQRYVMENLRRKEVLDSLREIIHSMLGVWGHLIEDLTISAAYI